MDTPKRGTAEWHEAQRRKGARIRSGAEPTPRQFVEITAAHVGKFLFSAFGREWRVSDFIGRILPGDIGKRVYLVGDTAKAFDAFLQVENDEQRARRQARGI